MMASLVRSAERSRILTACLALLTVVAGCGDPTAPLPREGAPDELHFTYGGFGMAGVTIEARGGTVAMWRRSWDSPAGGAIDTVRSSPTADAWREFWIAAKQAGVHRWRSRYVADGVIDGNGWTLRLVAGGFALESMGSNAYPDVLGRKRDLMMTEEFRALQTALGNLVGAEL